MSRLLSHCLLLTFFCLFVISNSDIAAAKNLSGITKLTIEEEQYLQQNPSIRVHVEDVWYPFNFIDKGLASGYSNDLIRLVANKVGLNVEFIAGYRWDEYLTKLKNEDIDVISNAKITPSRQQYAAYTHYHPLSIFDGLLVNGNKKRTVDFNKIQSLAVTENYPHQESIRDRYPHIKLVITTSLSDAIKQLIQNHVEAVLDNYDTLNFHLQNSPIKGVKNIPLLDDQIANYLPRFMAVPKGKKVLRDILDKGLLAITQNELIDLNEKWSLLNSSTIPLHKYNSQDQRVIFTNRQRAYLDEHKKITMCVHSDSLPIGAIEEGQYIGIAADFIELFSQSFKKDIILVETNTWEQALNAFSEGMCDFIPALTDTPERRKKMSFTFPYLRFPSVLVTHQDNRPYKLQQVLHKPLGIVKGYSYKEMFEDLYIGVKLKEYNSIEDAFNAVVQGEIYGFIDSLPVIAKKIQSTYPDFKVVEKFESEYTFSLAVAKDNIILLDIFNKLLASIKRHEQEYILNRWTPVLYEKNEDVSGYIVSIGLFVLLIIFLLFALYSSKKSNQKIEEMKLKLEKLAIHDHLTELPNRAYFKEQLNKEWARGQRSKEILSLIIIDIDNFKDFNEEFGRLEGDNCLIELSRRLQSIVKRPADLLARWEGEEFVILLPNTDEAGIKTITAEIFYMLNGWTFHAQDSRVERRISASIGAASMLIETAYSEKELIRRAFRALYKAQNIGYNQVLVYKSEM